MIRSTPIPSASPTSPTASIKLINDSPPPTPLDKYQTQKKMEVSSKAPEAEDVSSAITAPISRKAPKGGDILAQEVSELHFYDMTSGHFILQDSEVTAVVLDYGRWNCKFYNL